MIQKLKTLVSFTLGWWDFTIIVISYVSYLFISIINLVLQFYYVQLIRHFDKVVQAPSSLPGK